MEEYNNGNFKHNGKRIHPVKKVRRLVKSTGKTRTLDLNKTDCYERNNKRNSDVFSKVKTNNLLEQEETGKRHVENIKNNMINDVEDRMIAQLDFEKDLNNLK